MKPMKKKWIVLQVVILVASFYNAYNSAEILNGWYGDTTIHFWINGVAMIFSSSCAIVFGALLCIRGIEFSVKKFKEWILSIVKEELKNYPIVKSR